MAQISGTRTRRAAKTREQILRAALKVFSRKGFHAASMDEIAIELDATRGLLYYYFKTKDDILRALIANNPIVSGVDDLIAAVRNMPLREGLEAAFRSVRALLDANRELVRLLHLQSEMSVAEATVIYTDLRQQIYRAAAQLIEHRQRAGDLRAELDVRDLAKFVVDFLTFEFISDTNLGHIQSRSHYDAHVIDVLIHGIATPQGLAEKRLTPPDEARQLAD